MDFFEALWFVCVKFIFPIIGIALCVGGTVYLILLKDKFKQINQQLDDVKAQLDELEPTLFNIMKFNALFEDFLRIMSQFQNIVTKTKKKKA